jgi:adenylosuccinate synthase
VTHVTVVVGGQYGSEGKGAVAGFLGKTMDADDLAIRVAGPNAGHTAYDSKGEEWKLRAVPVAAVTSPSCKLHIAAGSEIDHNVLFAELDALDKAGHKASERLTIHPSATFLDSRHLSLERASGIVARIGSTGKGIGAARSERIARTAHLAKDVSGFQPLLGDPGPLDLNGVPWVVIEGTQGYGLGLHTSNYPQVTSSDCRAIDFLAMAGISPWAPGVDLEVIVVARTYPIRVAGNSGPMVGETTWEALGLAEERTTVTNKVRRVGGWDEELLREAIAANGGGGWNSTVKLAVTMLDQLYPAIAGDTDFSEWPDEPIDWLLSVQDEMETDVAYVGTGPQTMVEVAI